MEIDPGQASAGAGIVATILGWFGIRTLRRIDTIERNYVSRAELKEHVDTLNHSLEKGFSQNREDIKYIRGRVDKLSDQ